MFYQKPSWDLDVTGPLESIARAIVKIIDTGRTAQLISSLTNPVKPISWQNAVALSLYNKKIYDFFDTTSTLQPYWIAHLNSADYPNYAFNATLSNTSFSVFSQYVGVYLFDQYNILKKSDPEMALTFLNKACDRGIFNAYYEKLNNVLYDKFTSENGNDILPELITETLKFADTFWSPGYLNAGIIFLDAALHCKDSLSDYDKTIICLEAAIEALMTGFLLQETPSSQTLMETFYPDGGSMSILKKFSSHWSAMDTESAKDHLKRALQTNFNMENPDSLLDRMQLSATEKVGRIIEKHKPAPIISSKI